MTKKQDIELISCKSILLEIKEDVKSLHGKFENVDKIVAIHETYFKIIGAVILIVFTAVIGLVFKK